MKQKILIVEDEFIVANNLSLILSKADYEICGIAATVDEAKFFVEKFKPTWVLLDIFLQDGSQGTDLAEFLTGKGIAFIYISANTNQNILEKAKATHPYGFLVKPFRERDLLTMLDIAQEKHLYNVQFKRQQELLFQKQLELIAFTTIDVNDKLNQIPVIFQSLVQFDLMRVRITGQRDKRSEEITFVRAGYDEYQSLKQQELSAQIGFSGQHGNWFKAEMASDEVQKLYNSNEYSKLLSEDPSEKLLGKKYRLESKMSFLLKLNNGELGSLSFYSQKPNSYNAIQLGIFGKAARQLSQLLASINLGDTGQATGVLKEKTTNNPDKKMPPGLEGIIGKSPLLLNVLDKLTVVAPTQSSVLILGDSGTGKEKIAQCIHLLSPRKSKPMITINCAALPKDLIESELFGHEKGAFTGALEKRTGKFELANGGSIFLDEIGELPLEAQVKLLRVLQEREIEHVGGSKSIKVDVRVIAATNRKLEKEVAEGRFRLDLYYRLNVFPIELPALRERKADIALLADYFLGKFSRQMGKPQPTLSKAALQQLEAYNWPGNIRELEHLIERSLLLTNGTVISSINLPANQAEMLSLTGADHKMKTLEEMETDHILTVLKACKGKVQGPGGAAEILGLPSSTLNSKIKKLGIRRESYFNL